LLGKHATPPALNTLLKWMGRKKNHKLNLNSNINLFCFLFSKEKDWTKGILQLQQSNDFVVKTFLHRISTYHTPLIYQMVMKYF
jgi:hypothetical protein